MDNINTLTYHKISAKNGSAVNAVIFLHGYGSDGKDLLSLGQEWQDQLPDTIFISPDAPTPCEQNPAGFQWFSLLNYQRDILRQGAISALKYVDHFIGHVEEKFSIPSQNIALVGFSQGTMLALHYAITTSRQHAAILGYSGTLLATDADISTPCKDTPICLIHGEQDMVVPASGSEDAYLTLQTHGFTDVSLHQIPMLGHGIDLIGLKTGIQFLRDSFKS